MPRTLVIFAVKNQDLIAQLGRKATIAVELAHEDVQPMADSVYYTRAIEHLAGDGVISYMNDYTCLDLIHLAGDGVRATYSPDLLATMDEQLTAQYREVN